MAQGWVAMLFRRKASNDDEGRKDAVDPDLSYNDVDLQPHAGVGTPMYKELVSPITIARLYNALDWGAIRSGGLPFTFEVGVIAYCRNGRAINTTGWGIFSGGPGILAREIGDAGIRKALLDLSPQGTIVKTRRVSAGTLDGFPESYWMEGKLEILGYDLFIPSKYSSEVWERLPRPSNVVFPPPHSINDVYKTGIGSETTYVNEWWGSQAVELYAARLLDQRKNLLKEIALRLVSCHNEVGKDASDIPDVIAISGIGLHPMRDVGECNHNYRFIDRSSVKFRDMGMRGPECPRGLLYSLAILLSQLHPELAFTLNRIYIDDSNRLDCILVSGISRPKEQDGLESW